MATPTTGIATPPFCTLPWLVGYLQGWGDWGTIKVSPRNYHSHKKLREVKEFVSCEFIAFKIRERGKAIFEAPKCLYK